MLKPGFRAWLLAALLVPVPAAAQKSWSDPDLGIAMTLPDGFYDEALDPVGPQNVVACFIAPSRGEGETWIQLCVERLGMTLPREPLSNSDLPRGAQPASFTWKGMKLQGVRLETTRDGKPITVQVALVPLLKEGIRLKVTSPRAHNVAAQAALVGTLASLQGETNWLSRTERAEKAGESVGQIGGIIFAIGVGMWLMKRRMSKS